MDILYEAYRAGRIADAENTAESAKAKVDRFADDIHALQRKVDRLSLGCQALWEMLCERAGLSDNDLLAKMQEIDLRDGKMDGMISRRIMVCPSCHRNSSNKRTQCVYCGAALPNPNLFDSV